MKSLSRRDAIILGGAAAGAALAPRALDEADDLLSVSEGATAGAARREIATFRRSFDRDRALMNEASESAVDRWYLPPALERERHEYLFDFFKNQRARYMPQGVKDRVTPLMPGLAAQESRFHPDRESPAGAVTILQFLPSTYRGLGGELSIDELKEDFAEQVEFAFKHLDEGVYKVLDDEVNFDRLCDKYGVSGHEKNEFIALCVINGYKAGQTRMARVLNGFQSGFLVSSLPPDFDSTGLGLFYVMSNFMSGFGRDIEPGYGPQSHEYSLKVIAGAESLAEEFNQPYGLRVNHATWLKRGVGAGVGLVLADTAIRSAQKGEGLKSVPKNVVKSTLTAPVTAVQTFSRAVASIVNPKSTLKAKPKPKTTPRRKPASRDKTSRARTKPKSKGGLISRRNALRLGGLGALGTAVYFRDEVFGLVKDLLPSGPVGDLDNRLTVSEVEGVLNRLNARGVFLSSSWEGTSGQEENGEVDDCGRTTLAGLRHLVLSAIEELLDDLDLLDTGATHEQHSQAVVITGAAESCGHSDRHHGHGNGYALDFRSSTAQRIRNRLLAGAVENREGNADVFTNVGLNSVIGDKIFQYSNKYFLFGIEHQGQVFVAYFDAESTHKHLEMIPIETYQRHIIGIRGVYRDRVRNHILNHISS